MNPQRLKALGYYALFWIWVLFVEPIFMDATQNAVHKDVRSVGLAAILAIAMIAETAVWRSKVTRMRANNRMPESPALPVVLWIGHLLGSALICFVIISSLGLSLESMQEPSFTGIALLLLLMVVVIKEIVLLVQLFDTDVTTPRFSENLTSGSLLVESMVMHGCFWGVITANAAPLSSFSFTEMLLLQAPIATVMFFMSYIPARTLNCIEEYTECRAYRGKILTTLMYYGITAVFAIKAIY